MESQEREITFSTNLFDLPMEMLIYLGKFLELKHVFNFRCYSRYSREVGNAILSEYRTFSLEYPIMPYNESTFRVIVQQCRRLRKITFHISMGMYAIRDMFTDEIFEWFSNNPHLEEIDLAVCDIIASEALIPLATKCKKLVKLTILGPLPRNGFLRETFNDHNNYLLEVNFYSWIFYDLREMAEVLDFLKKQPQLRRISLPTTPTTINSLDIFLQILYTIAENCKELRYLKILWYNNMAQLQAALIKIVDNCSKLQTIDFTYNITPDELISYIKSKNIELRGIYPRNFFQQQSGL